MNDKTQESARTPSTDKPCEGGRHFTLGYRAEGGAAYYACPNKECRLFGKEVR